MKYTPIHNTSVAPDTIYATLAFNISSAVYNVVPSYSRCFNLFQLNFSHMTGAFFILESG